MWAGIYIMHAGQALHCTWQHRQGLYKRIIQICDWNTMVSEIWEQHRASASPGYGTQSLQYHSVQNRPKSCNNKKVPKCALTLCQKVVVWVFLSAQVERVSVSRMRNFWDGFPHIFCWILTNLCHVDSWKSIWGPHFPVKSHKTFVGHSGW